MSEKKPGPLLGRLAVHHSMLTVSQVSECTREQARDGNPKPLGEYFVAKGFLTAPQLQQLLREQKRVVEEHRAQQPAEHARAASASAAAAREPSPVKAIVERTPARVVRDPRVEPSEPPVLQAPAEKAQRATPAASEARAEVVFENVSRDSGPLDALLANAVEQGASDFHIHAGGPFRLRIQGDLKVKDATVIDAASTERLLIGALEPRDRVHLAERGQIDFNYTVNGVSRFRANVYRQHAGVDGVFRAIRPAPPSLADLGLPQDLARFTNYFQGMVLVTGPSGCGKSSTLAALVDLINQERKEHILTIEDPIEYQFTPKRCLVNQRSVNRHTGSFARALRAALREDPDVIVIGELRDLETISLALTAAETGHFVLATLHTGSTIRTLNRLVGAFPPNQQDQVRSMLSESLRAVVSQRLVRTADGARRVPALETLVVTKAVGNLIRENKTFQIRSILQTGSARGMCLLDQSLQTLLAAGTITREEALRHAEDPKLVAGS